MDKLCRIDRFVIGSLATACDLDVPRVSEEMDVANLGIDSLGLTILAMNIEREFECTFSGERMRELFAAYRVKDLIAVARAAANEF